ncbi:molecular chaperone HtpG [Agathobacter ruminis]|uniref:Molecular chaperone HtpG n=1 Tax=Agathobacter ruminis TaxID=1712665 RepID=A0A2G3E2N1_9FIRM|nr:molecular chaperone HtpG [Agathobacter ruminis]MDC7302400.1 molecular chaperone HtpG [Agathobacter ruminis]PHU37537.1 molecular chaperone HtpG [Agathobacter ruminis]
MSEKHGTLSIDSDNLFPIIKKWLYSDHDIFYRELISNGCDAITKLKKLDMMGECALPSDYKGKISVLVNPEEKTIKIIDNGLGMTADEVEEYISRIAFSGATDFIEKYKDKSNDDQIIGHFGLGFYSAFMVADEVTINTLSYQDGATPVFWSCDGGTEYEMKDGDRTEVGTEITLHLNEDCLEFANEYRAREIIEKYCSFMPTEIYLAKENAPEEYETIDKADRLDTDRVIEEIHEEAKTEEREKEDGTKETVEVSPASDKLKIVKRPVALNDIHPLWAKNPNDCTDEEYKAFYRKVFLDYKEPLFWIHLNMDYPFNLKGILYFPKINTEYESIEGKIKLYNNQVFIADNIKEVIPEFLMLLKGVIDCPDLPLNVSRSALQNDGFVRKISEYITKKVADKLIGLCKTDKENYEKYWDDISPFIKFGCLKDGKFCDKMNDYILFKDINDKYLTLPELLVPVEEPEGETETKPKESADNEEKKQKTVYYVTDKVQQSQYINLFKEQGLNAVILDQAIDTSFITQLEQRNEHYRFARVDAEMTDTLKDDSNDTNLEEETKALSELFKKVLNNDKLTVTVEALKNAEIASVLTLSEQGRRMQDMMKMYAAGGMGAMDFNMFAADQTLTLNANNELVQYIFKHSDSEHVPTFVEQLYDLAVLANQPLSPEAMTKFVNRTNKIMLLLAK